MTDARLPFAGSASLLALLLLSACASRPSLRARDDRGELLDAAVTDKVTGAADTRYLVRVAAGHGYQRGQLVSLFAALPGAGDAIAVGLAVVQEPNATSLLLTERFLEERY